MKTNKEFSSFNKIYLIGMPACGKSTLGKKLANALNWFFIDADKWIEEEEKMSISEIFNTKGEAYFRHKEQNILKKITTLRCSVIATGGGMPCFFDNIEQMNRSGITIFLDVPTTILAKRIFYRRKKRPIWASMSYDQIRYDLMIRREQRLAFYQKATFSISKEEILVDSIIEKLKLLY